MVRDRVLVGGGGGLVGDVGGGRGSHLGSGFILRLLGLSLGGAGVHDPFAGIIQIKFRAVYSQPYPPEGGRHRLTHVI